MFLQMFCILYPKICQLNKFSLDWGDSQKKEKKIVCINVTQYVIYTKNARATSNFDLVKYFLSLSLSPKHKNVVIYIYIFIYS